MYSSFQTNLTHACHGCDNRREQERAFCDDCDEVTPGYAWSDTQEVRFTRLRQGFVVDDEGAV